MRKVIYLVAASLMLSGSAFALSSNTKILTPEPCQHLHTVQQCISYPTGECFWDYEDERCENYNTGHGRCDGLSKYACVNRPDCFWDEDDERCERR